VGLQISGIFIDALPGQSCIDQEAILEFEKIKLPNLSPEKISIAFSDNKTLIVYDKLFENILTEEKIFSDFEKQLNMLFPGATKLSIVINDLIDFIGFSLTAGDEKIRTKATFRGEIFIDYGILISEESNLYDQTIKAFEANEVFYSNIQNKYGNLNPEDFQKAVLKIRDNLYLKKGAENKYNYANGLLDRFTSESLFLWFLKKDYLTIEETTEFYQFQSKKINLIKDIRKLISQAYLLRIRGHDFC
jgi:hypothetical protein